MARRLFFFGVLFFAFGCETNAPPAPKPPATGEDSAVVVPAGFNKSLLDILRCPENLSVVRLATQKELVSTNERIKSGKIKSWGGEVITKPTEGMLIRADSKIGYRFERHAPVLIIEEALVLDETVGRPNPDKYQK